MNEFLIGALVFFPFLGGLLIVAFGNKDENKRDFFAIGVTVLEMAMMLALFAMNKNAVWQQTDIWNSGAAGLYLKDICGFGLNFQVDGFRLIYGTVAAFMWMMATMISREYLSIMETETVSMYLCC